jgi:hypothetical protein
MCQVCAKLGLYHEVDQVDRIFGFRDNNGTPGETVLRVSYREILSSKVIMMEGVLLNTVTIKTFGTDSTWRKWYL